MKAMSSHEFLDEDVVSVRFDGHENIREIVLKESNEGSLQISKQDVIALSKEFGLMVFDRKSEL